LTLHQTDPTGPADAVTVEAEGRNDGPVPLLIGARDLARLLGISKATLERMKAAGRLPSPVVLSAGCHRWRLDEVRAWVAAGCPSRAEFDARRDKRR
jgi:predicted DNA-binding transcriptional regulator AlpA